MMLTRRSFFISLFVCFITISSLSSTEISAINEEGESINQGSSADKSRLKQLETIVFEQNDRLAFLEKQNGYRKEEHHILNAELSKHKNEIDQLNDLLLQVNIRSQPPSTAEVSRLKRPARLLPISILRPKKKNETINDEPDPSSCIDLNDLGHTLNGIYLIKKNASRKVEAVYCNFQPPTGSLPAERPLGYLNVKSASGVYFHVRMKYDKGNIWNQNGVMRSFKIERMNVGNAMNISTGIFTAPKAGIYHFSANFVKAHGSLTDNNPHLLVVLCVNGHTIAEANIYVAHVPLSAFASMETSVKLRKGDRVNLSKNYGLLEGNTNSHSFSGWLVEEDLE